MAKIKNKIALPFKIVKSEVSGGFIDKVHEQFASGVDIVNTGEDIVNGYFEANVQSPFTQQWVGGKTHRHVPLNDGEDRSENRPEAWHLEFSPEKINFYSHAYRNSQFFFEHYSIFCSQSLGFFHDFFHFSIERFFNRSNTSEF